jgi:3-deoxy-D-manno-octulosonate 8-phosphate phosphatase (KDO 8-P phosphatase)
MKHLIEKAKKIRLAIFDVDGVLTSGKLFYGPSGHELKTFHVHDGQGLKFLQKTGVEIAIITAKKSEIITQRMSDLEIKFVYQGNGDKLPAYEDLKQKLKLNDDEISYVGDDLPDLPVICRVGLGITVPNAPKIMHDYAHWVTTAKGGKGAVREVCDFIMQSQGTYQTILDGYAKR